MSHGPPDLPIHLVPPLGGLLSTRGGHGKGLQPCFTIREDFTDRGADILHTVRMLGATGPGRGRGLAASRGIHCRDHAGPPNAISPA